MQCSACMQAPLTFLLYIKPVKVAAQAIGCFVSVGVGVFFFNQKNLILHVYLTRSSVLGHRQWKKCMRQNSNI